MFEKFTDRARKVMALANQESQRFNHDYIKAEHILWGLIREESGVGATALRNLNVDLKKMRLEVEELMIKGPDEVTMGKLPPGPGAKRVVENTIEEARLLHSEYIGTEHLLLSIMRETEGITAQLLKNHNLTYEQVRNEISNLLGIDACSEKCDKPMIQRFSDRARKILSLANQEAQRYNHEYIDTEHILLGFIREGSGVGMAVLKNLNVDIKKLRLDIEKLMIKGPDIVAMGKLEMEPRAKKVIEYAIEGARSLNRNYVGSEHLLLGLMYETKGSIASQVLKDHKLTYEQVRNEILKLLKKGFVCCDECDKAVRRSFTDRARKVMTLADQAAQRYNHVYIDTEHVLLGFIREGSGVGMAVLKNLNVDVDKLRLEVEELMIKCPVMVKTGKLKLPYTQHIKKIVEYAIEEASSLKSEYVGTEHLLLSMMRETEGMAAQVLKDHKLTYEQVRNEIVELTGK